MFRFYLNYIIYMCRTRLDSMESSSEVFCLLKVPCDGKYLTTKYKWSVDEEN